MLTSYQAATVAYSGDQTGDIYCLDCADAGLIEAGIEVPDGDGWRGYEDAMEEAGYAALCRYSVDEAFPGGLWCGSCDEEIVEPADDYCTFHESWRAYQGGKRRRWCDDATVNRISVDLEEARICSFPS